MSELDEGFKPLNRQLGGIPQKQHEEEKEKKLKNFAVKIEEDLVDKVNDYAFWEGYSQSEVIEQALEEFFQSREVKPMPERVRKKMEEQARRRRKGRR